MFFLCVAVGAMLFVFFFFNDTATTEIYTLSLHDALPICPTFAVAAAFAGGLLVIDGLACFAVARVFKDRKSTRLNSSHEWISYAVFCLKKKKKNKKKNKRNKQCNRRLYNNE